MNPIPPEDYQSQGPLYCARAFSRYTGERLVFLALAFSAENEAIYECAKLCIEDSVVQRAEWGYVNQPNPVELTACEKFKIHPEDLALAGSESQFLSALCLTVVGSTVVVADSDKGAFDVLAKKAAALGLDFVPKQVVTVSGLAQTFGLTPGASFEQALSWATPGRERVASPRQYGRVMEAAGFFDSMVFTRGSLAVQDSLGAPQAPSILVEHKTGASNETRGASNVAPDKAVGKQTIRTWLESASSSKHFFPAFSASYLMRGLLEKSPAKDFDLTEESFGFELSNLLKEGLVSPDLILHKKLYEELLPILSLYKDKVGVRLTEVKETADKIRSKPVDFVMLRAALMKSGHPTYQVKSQTTNKTTRPAKGSTISIGA